MSLFALCSATGAPGVTTTALALGWVWPLAHPDRRVLVVDADVAGSGILPGYAQAGVPAGGGVLGLAAERTSVTAEAIAEHAVALDPDARRLVLTGLSATAQARPLTPVWQSLADAAPSLDAAQTDVVVDIGRLGHRYEPTPLIEQADVVMVVLGSTLTSVTAAVAAVRALRGSRGPGPTTMALLVNDGGPYSAREIATELELDRLPVIATDRWAARALAEGGTTGWRFDRSPLLRSAREVAAYLRDTVATLRVGAPS
jgi:MinD-like ATPase involved in chromosome partitioning or flagellar assembly